jgi:hypothetical protein
LIVAVVGLNIPACHASGVSPLCIGSPLEWAGWNIVTSRVSAPEKNPAPVANMPCGHLTSKVAPLFGEMSLEGLLIAITFSCSASVIAPPTKFLMSSCDGTCRPSPLSSEEVDVVLLLEIGVVALVAYTVGTTNIAPTELNPMIANTIIDFISICFIWIGGRHKQNSYELLLIILHKNQDFLAYKDKS